MISLISQFIDSVKLTSLGKNEGWPLSGPQVLPYFDVDQALDIYDMVNELKSQNLSNYEIGKLFQTPTMMRYHIKSTIVSGLKIADKIKKRKIPTEERIRFCKLYFEILSSLVYSDPFCLDQKNLIISPDQLESIFNDVIWFDINDDTKKIFVNFSVDLFHYAWSLYYNLFAGAGFEIHGPYEIKVDGRDCTLIIRDSLNMTPSGIWDINPGIDRVRVFMLYDKIDYKLTYYNQPTAEGHQEKLRKVAIKIDNKNTSNVQMVELLSKKISSLALLSAKHINSLPKKEQAYKGAEISFFMLKDLYNRVGKTPDVKNIFENTFKILGSKPLEEGKEDFRERSKDSWIKLFDPRDDSLGDINLP